MKSRAILSAILFAIVFASLLYVHHGQNVNAQGLPSTIDGLSLNVSTNSPSPGQKVTLMAESYVVSLNAANITWTLNGNVYQKGLGITSIDVTAPELGKTLSVKASAVTSDGRQFSSSIDIKSSMVDIIVETDGYTPPFFDGKIPLSYQNGYNIIAVPHITNSSGSEYDPRDLIYSWSRNSRIVQESSGYGRQVLSLKEDAIPRPRAISVSITSRDGKVRAEETIILQAESPFIRFYVNDPLYGPLYNKALGTAISLGKSRELSVLSVPFGFNKPADTSGNLSFSWFINSIKQAALSSSQSIVLRAPEEGSGSSNVRLDTKNDLDFLQRATGGFSASFSSNTSSLQSSDNTNFNGI